jgi:ribosomal protein L37AE/L43A
MPETTFPDQRTNRADTPIRVCDKCNANMTLLSELPKFHDHAAAKIFRCYACNNVLLQER